MADDEQLVPSWADITGQLSAMNTRWQTELCAGLDREKNLKQRVVELEVVVTKRSLLNGFLSARITPSVFQPKLKY